MRVLPINTAFTAEAMDFSTRWVPTDDNFGELGVVLRDPRQTFADAIRAYHAAGLVTARQAGRLAA
jgi:hypothetical protein